MIQATAGAELCATPSNTNPQPSDCVKAVDHTYKGEVDLSDRVQVGEPIQKSPLQWSVPYDVKDDAGNAAITIWRDVVVQEVDLASVESLIRAEITREQESLQQKAIQKAIREEKIKWEREQSSNNNRNRKPNSSATSCPACPSCVCPDTAATTKESCSQYCENMSKSCSLSDENFIYFLLLWLENYLTPSLVPAILLVALTFLVFVVLRFLIATIYNPRTYESYSYASYAHTNDGMFLRTPQPSMEQNSLPQSVQHFPTMDNTNGTNGTLFSPQRQTGFTSPSFATGNGTPRNRPADPLYDESIYMSPPIITPSKTGDGVRRRNF